MTADIFIIELALLIGVTLLAVLAGLVSCGGCRHRRTSFPQKPRSAMLADLTHVTCLDCGREFRYDWERMARGEELPWAGYSAPREDSGAVPASGELRRRYATHQN